VNRGRLSIKCESCRVWNDIGGGWIYHKMTLTSWRPISGLDPHLRKFHCSFCGVDEYVRISSIPLKELVIGQML